MDWVGDHAWETWLIVSGVLAAAELLSLDLVLLMLSVGGLVGVVTALAGGPFILQLLLAVVTALGMLALVRPPIVHRLHAGPDLATGTRALLGRHATVLAEMGPESPGRIKLGGEEWRALPYDETDHLAPGDIVEVLRVEGTTAYVLRLPGIES